MKRTIKAPRNRGGAFFYFAALQRAYNRPVEPREVQLWTYRPIIDKSLPDAMSHASAVDMG